MTTKWGIASAGLISHDFATAVATLPANEHKLVAVAARDPMRAKEFATRHNIPHVHSSYEELARNADVGQFNIDVMKGNNIRGKC